MKTLVIGDSPFAHELSGALRSAGLEAAVAEPAGAQGSEIARELVHLESVLSDGETDAVVLTDAGERSLAGALVATKLLIPVAAIESGDRDGANAALLAQLADGVLPAEAGAIAAWARSASRPSPPTGG